MEQNFFVIYFILFIIIYRMIHVTVWTKLFASFPGRNMDFKTRYEIEKWIYRFDFLGDLL